MRGSCPSRLLPAVRGMRTGVPCASLYQAYAQIGGIPGCDVPHKPRASIPSPSVHKIAKRSAMICVPGHVRRQSGGVGKGVPGGAVTCPRRRVGRASGTTPCCDGVSGGTAGWGGAGGSEDQSGSAARRLRVRSHATPWLGARVTRMGDAAFRRSACRLAPTPARCGSGRRGPRRESRRARHRAHRLEGGVAKARKRASPRKKVPPRIRPPAGDQRLGHPHDLVRLTRQFPSDEGDRDDAGGAQLIHEPPECERVTQLPGTLGQQFLDLDLADHVARAVPGLLQVQVLLEPDQIAVGREPASRASTRTRTAPPPPSSIRSHACTGRQALAPRAARGGCRPAHGCVGDRRAGRRASSSPRRPWPGPPRVRRRCCTAAAPAGSGSAWGSSRMRARSNQ